MKATKELLNEISNILTKYERISNISGENFNIFKVINFTTREVEVHSRFLAELLNPQGSHGQGDIFLKLFISEFISHNENFDTETAKVFVEKDIGPKTKTKGGRIDILVQNNHKKTIIIENKINAEDQENQLIRYYNYSKDNVFYLTLFGDEPSEKSAGNLQLEKDFKLLSYKYDILNWLQKCEKEVTDLSSLREGIKHYINLIKYLTGISNNRKMEEEIRNIILATPKNLEVANTLVGGLKEAKIEIQYLFWKFLKKDIEDKAVKIIGESESVSKQTVVDFYQKSKNNKNYGLCYKIFEKKEIAIYYEIQIYDEIYSGFNFERNEEKEELKKISKILKEIDINYESNEYWLGWKYTEPKLNFVNFNSDIMFQLADINYLKKVVSEIADNSIKDIKLLRKELKNIDFD